jgi:phosphinothricin acetyltransferase
MNQLHELNIRAGQATDLPELTNIYNYYVANTNVTFDTEPSTVDQRKEWLAKFSTSGPYRLLVAEHNGAILGSATSSQFRLHPSFIQTVEFGIYLHPEARGKGIGKLLYSHLFTIVEKEPIHAIVAGVALPNPASVQLHKSFGFSEVGVFSEYAIKNGQYISSVWFQKLLTNNK